MRISIIVGVVALVGIAVVGTGCVNNYARDRAEREILNALPGAIGPAESYSVNVDGNAREIMRGRLRSVQIQGVNVVPDQLPRLARMDAQVTDLQLDTDKYEVISSGSAQWTGWMDEEELTKLLQNRVSLISDLSVQIEDGQTSVIGKVSYMGVTASGRLFVQPEVRNQREIWLTPVRVEGFGIGSGIPSWMGDRVANIVNPVYRIRQDELDLRLSSIQVENNLIRLDGTMDPKGLAGIRR